jgi:histidinol-phosphate aminotransferase
VRAIAVASENRLARYPDATAAAFRQCAAGVLRADLPEIEPDWILCGNGSDDILTIATRAFVSEGDRIRLPYPSYVLYKTLAEIQGAASEEIHFHRDWTLPASFRAGGDRLRLVYLPNPNSPSGTLISPEQVSDIARSLDCPLLVDEAYVDFADRNCLHLVGAHDNVLVSRSLSKSYALAGLRFGYVVARPEIIAGLAKVKDSYNCDALSIAAATAAVDDQTWLAENRSHILATRRRLVDAMVSLGFNACPSQANFLWNTHPGQPVKPLYERLKAERILVRYMDYPGWGDGLRISVGTDEQIDACVAVLGKLV